MDVPVFQFLAASLNLGIVHPVVFDLEAVQEKCRKVSSLSLREFGGFFADFSNR